MSSIAELAGAIAGGAGAGGLIGSALTAYTAKKKVSAEVDSIVVTSAETTVQAALAVAAAEANRADRAEAENAELRARLESALARVDALQTALDSVRDELNAIKYQTEH